MNHKKNTGTLYLIPALLGGENTHDVLPEFNHTVITGLRHFIVEDLRSARRFLRKTGFTHDFSNVHFGEINKHTDPSEYVQRILPLEEGFDMGLISEAGVPCLADPGAEIVKIAQQRNLRVVPLTGPSSIILALIASGFNGQNFCFHGYLPVQPPERERKITELEKNCYAMHQTQIFIETPYRNLAMIDSLLKKCRGETLLCIACNITLEEESIRTMPIAEWKKSALPYHKKPTVFLLFHP
ncbi:MAG: SAM-dependent methyltransferase [Bacteroidales bacterium]|nr:SAM-dependent methyltransferase [Bacteroidales bacterium]MDD3962561.1 SAM-dependent methyltransferase [Bacteroidales bacterium]MDY0284876.1 SAM-dependent methyltransferase [Bacteroidales bacterium]